MLIKLNEGTIMKKGLIYDIFTNIPTIETERLILRKMMVSDADDMYEYSCKSEVTKYLLWSPHPDRYYTIDYLKFIGKRYKLGEFYDWAVIEKESGKMIGTCGFAKIDMQNRSAEIGYVLNPDFWGKGYATEMVGRVIDFGFRKVKLNRLECRYMVENVQSRRVMEKNGMTFEGVHRGYLYVKEKYRDIGFCAILREDYFGNKKSNQDDLSEEK